MNKSQGPFCDEHGYTLTEEAAHSQRLATQTGPLRIPPEVGSLTFQFFQDAIPVLNVLQLNGKQIIVRTGAPW